jgi:hypothetical protein
MKVSIYRTHLYPKSIYTLLFVYTDYNKGMVIDIPIVNINPTGY